jgi:hypothetical protein
VTFKTFEHRDKQAVIHTTGDTCVNKQDLLGSDAFRTVVGLYLRHLDRRGAALLDTLGWGAHRTDRARVVADLLQRLGDAPLSELAASNPDVGGLPAAALHAFVEGLYDFWRSLDRFMILHGEPGHSGLDARPFRAFNATVETLTSQVRGAYRDICENITGDHPRIYRQVPAGCNVACIGIPRPAALPESLRSVAAEVPTIRQVWIDPPMIIDPPMNRRSGRFQRVNTNPVEGLSLRRDEWLCYPAMVGSLLINVYFHLRFMGLGTALANLFELASDARLEAPADALLFYGLPLDSMARFGDLPTVFYDGEDDGIMVGAIPLEDRFGYFGYLKKLSLTLHNVIMMKRGRMPFHGAMVRLTLQGDRTATLLILGDTATGKSESLEALRVQGERRIRDMHVISDDMGSLEVGSDDRVLGYGTEVGAFVRLDDLQQGYAFGQIDRAIIMSPQKVNARVVLPITTLEEVLHGYALDYLLYANNYEAVDDSHPVLEHFDSVERALGVFREGTAMAKGTTSSKGLVHSYFANVFGPPQYRELHESLAEEVFRAAFGAEVYVGQVRTRLAIPGYSTSGPGEAAHALLGLLESTPSRQE